MDEKKVIVELLKDVLNRLDSDSYPPSKKSIYPRKANGAALALVSLILGILLGVFAAALLK